MAGRESKSKRQVAKWKPPPSDWVKINVDGAFDEQIGEAVIGIVIRNDQGKVKLGDIFSKVAMQRRSKRLCPRREQNGAAHELAQLAKHTRHAVVWHMRCPVCIEQVIAQECNSFSEY
uniref:RNase H type-1 domain-containing protein n=1 Tax=Setaria viridis TaxID=4556 RepID=A0A4U6SZP6_SETVI|nr:hypothetical protein SEVIR_9G307200v2 [Setaria viridis]